VSSLYGCEKERLADKFIKLLFAARSLRDASAQRITLVVPYLAYQRQDRKTESRAPVYTKYVPEMIEGLLGRDARVLTMDAHNLSAFQTGFRCLIDHLEAKPLVGDWFGHNIKDFDVDLDNLVVCSPDEGGGETNWILPQEIARGHWCWRLDRRLFTKKKAPREVRKAEKLRLTG
jgi:ribose-phosphate pyrophosphokinase